MYAVINGVVYNDKEVKEELEESSYKVEETRKQNAGYGNVLIYLRMKKCPYISTVLSLLDKHKNEIDVIKFIDNPFNRAGYKCRMESSLLPEIIENELNELLQAVQNDKLKALQTGSELTEKAKKKIESIKKKEIGNIKIKPCTLCGDNSTFSATIFHLKSCHGDLKSYTCPRCNKFISNTKLSNHLKSCKGVEND